MNYYYNYFIFIEFILIKIYSTFKGLIPKPPNFDQGTSPSNKIKINEVQEKQTQNIL